MYYFDCRHALEVHSCIISLHNTGKLDAPRDIVAIFDANMIHISWLQPFTLEGVTINSYLVNVAIVMEFNHSIPWINDTTMMEMASIPVVDNSSCTVYVTHVQAETLAGLGEPGSINVSRIGGQECFNHHVNMLVYLVLSS